MPTAEMYGPDLTGEFETIPVVDLQGGDIIPSHDGLYHLLMPFIVTTKRPGPTPRDFWEWVNPDGDCWLWTGGLTDGYGSWWDGSRTRRAHLAAYEALVGPTPTDLQADHICRRRACVNPDHIEFTTGRVNTLRGAGPTARHARKTHCPRGHEYDSESRGRRVCLTCKREKMRAARARKAA